MAVIHIIGAGGVGMSALALLLKRAGATVTASDKNDSPYLQNLAQVGIRTWVGSRPQAIPAGAHVYYSSAIRADDEERKFAEANGLQCEGRHSLLRALSENYFTIAVAGCHGKTTTSAWIADLLIRAGYDPTALIGGTVPAWQSNYREGQGAMQGKPLLVIEADESDRSFLSIATDIALVTNVDLDHTDVHANLTTLEQDFSKFVDQTRTRGGSVFLSKEYSGKLETYLNARERSIRDSIAVVPDTGIMHAGKSQFAIGLAGIHNRMNASLVLQLALHLDIPHRYIAQSLAEFSGVNRRMQKIAEFAHLNLAVIDDYAHHPHEVSATLAALAVQYERLLIFWEPHRLSRFVYFHEEFAQALERYRSPHRLFTLPIFNAGDSPADYPQATRLFTRFTSPPFTHLESASDFTRADFALRQARTAAVFMGAGLSSQYAEKFVSAIA